MTPRLEGLLGLAALVGIFHPRAGWVLLFVFASTGF